MSSGAECYFSEKSDGWWYAIQDWPYGAWPGFTEHGPFASEDEAFEHLQGHYQNPGGYCIVSPDHFEGVIR